MAEFNQLGQYLKEKRVASGLTQAELASKLGDVHSQFVSNWERGLCAPPGHAFQDLIGILKLNREHLVEVMLIDSQKTIKAKVYKKKSKANKKSA